MFLTDYRPFHCGVHQDAVSLSRAPSNIRVSVMVSFMTGAVRSAILATAGLLVLASFTTNIPKREIRRNSPSSCSTVIAAAVGEEQNCGSDDISRQISS